MTTISTNTFGQSTAKQGLGARIMALLVRMTEAHPQYRRAEYLNSLSDAELAKLGMTRGEIPARVYGTRFI